MLKYVIFTYSLHIRDVFDKIPVMASRDRVKVLFNYLH